MRNFLQIISAIFLYFLTISASCDKGAEGCTDPSACNYDVTAAIEDYSCWFVSEDCSCDDEPGSTADCLGICDAELSNNPPEDSLGVCLPSVVGGCIDAEKCNYNSSATHNDGSCAVDLSLYGGDNSGLDCNNICGGKAVVDACSVCVEGETSDLGDSWRIGVKAIAVFSDSSRAVDSSLIGASIYAHDSYNNTDLTNGECSICYLDIAESCQFADSLCFYFPHDEWEGQLDTNFTSGYDFDRDIRGQNLQTIFSDGLTWNAEIYSPVLTSLHKIDSLQIQFDLIEGIEYCSMIIERDFGNEKEIIIEKDDEASAKVDMEIGSGEIIKLTLTIKNICYI